MRFLDGNLKNNMYRSHLLVIIALFTWCQNSNAQSGRIAGKLVQQHSLKPIPWATVALRTTVDSAITKTILTDSLGNFLIFDLKYGNYEIYFSQLGFKQKQLNVALSETIKEVNLGNVVLAEDATSLSTVQVTGKVPLFRSRADGTMEVDVAGSVLAASSSVNEILAHTPGVAVTEQGLSVIGKGEAILYLNGKRTTAQQLASLGVDQISKIEVVANPSAKYDAEGNAIINVITFSPLGEGYHVNVRNQFSVSDFTTPLFSSTVDGNYKKGALEFRAGYGLSVGTNRETLNTSRIRSAAGDEFFSDLMTDWKRKQLNFSNLSAGIQYNINSKSYLSTEYLGSLNHLGGTTANTNTIISPTLQGNFASLVKPDVTTDNHSLSANFHSNLDTLGTGFVLGAQLVDYRSVNEDNIFERGAAADGSLAQSISNDAHQHIKLGILQADFTSLIFKTVKLEVGGKLSSAQIDSETKFFRLSENQDQLEMKALSAQFTYNEQISALYGNLLGAIGSRFSYGLGLRAEHTFYRLSIAEGVSSGEPRNYTNLFPNVFGAFKINEQLRLRAAYTNRIVRPRYQALNPSIIYQDAFTSIVGNPLLRAENVHALEIGANYLAYSFKIGYNHVDHPISAAALRSDQPNAYVLKSLNFSTLDTWLASVTVPISVSFWNAVNTASITLDTYKATALDFVMRKPTPQLYIYSTNTFKLGKVMELQLLASYQGRRSSGTTLNKGRGLLSVAIDRQFLAGALKVNLMANDLLTTDRPSGNYEVGGTFVTFARKNNTRYYRASVSYNFGKLKRSTFKNTKVGQVESGRAF
jgi:hypothetical protein